MLRERVWVDFPDLHLVEQGDTVIVKGAFPLVDGKTIVDRFLIEIELPRTYPRGLPILREVGGRIPREMDRHVEGDGKACVFLPDEYSYRHPDGMELLNFLKGPVLGFLVGQSLAEHGQPWPQGERGHGSDGIVAFYGELLGTEDLKTIRRYLEALAAKQLKGHWECPCGSGRRVRQCHHEQLLRLRGRIPRSVVRESLEMIRGRAPKT